MAEAHKGRVGFEDTLNFTNSLCVAYTLCSVILRGWIRRDIYGIDDVVIAAATLTTLGFFAANYVALEHGAGKPWSYIEDAHDVMSFDQASMASLVFFTVSLYLSKSSVVAFLLRLTRDRRQILLHRICLVCLGAIGLASVLLLTAGWPSQAGHYWASSSDDSTCATQSSRWAIWTALDITTELLLLVLPLHMTWNLQMPTRRKLAVLSAFYLRIPVIGISIGRLVFTRKLCSQSNSNDLGLDTALVLIWICIEATYALLASHFLALRALTLSFNSGFGFGFTINAGPESYSMQHRSRTDGKSRSGGGTQDAGPSRLVTAGGAGHESRSTLRDKASLSILRETEYSVQYQDVADEAPILSRA